MAVPLNSYSLFPLGDSAITLDLGPFIDEHHNIRVLAIQRWLETHRFPGLLDIIVAYSSVTVFYDPAVLRAARVTEGRTAAAWVEELLMRGWEACANGHPADAPEASRGGHSFRIPVCYEGEYAPDLEQVARDRGLSTREVIELHCTGIYRVYMIGFLPGFPYLGPIDERLEIPRKMRPGPVMAGGVGIAGRQTGIYPVNSPGGWWIIGRTPVKLFDPALDPPVRLQAGDHVEFYPISHEEFQRLIE